MTGQPFVTAAGKTKSLNRLCIHTKPRRGMRHANPKILFARVNLGKVSKNILFMDTNINANFLRITTYFSRQAGYAKSLSKGLAMRRRS